MFYHCSFFFFFFFNDTATTEIYTLSLHDALPICSVSRSARAAPGSSSSRSTATSGCVVQGSWPKRSEEHTSELQSQSNLVCRLLLEKKKNKELHSTYHSLLYAACTKQLCRSRRYL